MQRLTMVTYTTFLVKQNSEIKEPLFCNKCLFLLEFCSIKKPQPILLSDAKIGIWNFLFYKENVRQKVFFSKFKRSVGF